MKASQPYFIKTKRIGFSHWDENDLSLAISLWGEEGVSRYLSKTGVFSKEEIQNKLTVEINNQKEHSVQYWPIFELSSGQFIGCCGLRLTGLRPLPQEGVYETGFHLKSKFWGQGLAHEAAIGVIDYAFNNLGANFLIAGHHPNNVVSKNVLEKLGFKYISDSFYAPTGLMHPTYVFNKPEQCFQRESSNQQINK